MNETGGEGTIPPGPGTAQRSILGRIVALLPGRSNSDRTGEESTATDEQLKGLAGYLAKGGALLTAILTLLGINSGQLDRIFRSEPERALGFLGLVGFSIVVGVLVLTAKTRLSPRRLIGMLASAGIAVFAIWQYSNGEVGTIGANRETIFLSTAMVAALLFLFFVSKVLTLRGTVLAMGAIALLAGLAGMGILAVDSKAAKDRPRIAASLVRGTSGWVIEGAITAQGLNIREHVLVRVEGLSVRQPLDYRRSGRTPDARANADALNSLAPGSDFIQTLHLTRQGPDLEGKVEISLTVPVTAGLYERVRVSALLETDKAAKAGTELRRLEDEEQAAQTALETVLEQGAATPDLIVASSASEVARRNLAAYRLANNVLLDRGSNCDSRANDRSCATLTFPQVSIRPDLALQQAPDKLNTVTLAVAAADVNVDDVVEIVVVTPAGVIYRAAWSPAESGAVKRDIVISVSPDTTHVCAAARIVEGPMLSATRGADGRFAPAVPPNFLVITCPAANRLWDISTAELDMPRPSAA